jgi:hypothetical protein
VLKPGGHLVSFGAPRTWHRLAVGLEDAGLEIRDTLAWLFGGGLPKSKNLTGAHTGAGTALKPAWEPIVPARAPLAVRSVQRNTEAFGTGALPDRRLPNHGRRPRSLRRQLLRRPRPRPHASGPQQQGAARGRRLRGRRRTLAGQRAARP